MSTPPQSRLNAAERPEIADASDNIFIRATATFGGRRSRSSEVSQGETKRTVDAREQVANQSMGQRGFSTSSKKRAKGKVDDRKRGKKKRKEK